MTQAEKAALDAKEQFVNSLTRAMKRERVTPAELARRMETSRAQVYRLLQTRDSSVTLTTISRIATALGRTVRIGLR
jgi:antitoxin HicB